MSDLLVLNTFNKKVKNGLKIFSYLKRNLNLYGAKHISFKTVINAIRLNNHLAFVMPFYPVVRDSVQFEVTDNITKHHLEFEVFKDNIHILLDLNTGNRYEIDDNSYFICSKILEYFMYGDFNQISAYILHMNDFLEASAAEQQFTQQ